MSEYDTRKDKMLHYHGAIIGTGKDKAPTLQGDEWQVATRSYDGKTPKVSIFRNILDKNTKKNTVQQLLRLPQDELLSISKFIVTAFSQQGE